MELRVEVGAESVKGEAGAVGRVEGGLGMSLTRFTICPHGSSASRNWKQVAWGLS